MLIYIYIYATKNTTSDCMMLILMFSTAQIWLPCLPWVQPCLDDLALAVGLPRSVEKARRTADVWIALLSLLRRWWRRWRGWSRRSRRSRFGARPWWRHHIHHDGKVLGKGHGDGNGGNGGNGQGCFSCGVLCQPGTGGGGGGGGCGGRGGPLRGQPGGG